MSRYGRRKSYALGQGTPPPPLLCVIPDTDQAVDFHQGRIVSPRHEQRRGSVPARPGRGAVAHLVGQLAAKSEVRGSNPSPGQIN
ncbi:hypothetical protein PoB_000189000 [Plakobranchus ocellatus]|uniref:Uncharacterized protein n=1 Tax=Plakobranchus ocellatus TaxID=259542 RepID=A0AAV3XY94_9GAST|nr:hypothetical protein PoB_000189000 [Plakobranchus ocellatus]